MARFSRNEAPPLPTGTFRSVAVNAIEGCSSNRSTRTILPAWSLHRTFTGAGRRCTVLPISQINSPDQFAVTCRKRPTIEVSYHCTVSAMEIFTRMTGAPGHPRLCYHLSRLSRLPDALRRAPAGLFRCGVMIAKASSSRWRLGKSKGQSGSCISSINYYKYKYCH